MNKLLFLLLLLMLSINSFASKLTLPLPNDSVVTDNQQYKIFNYKQELEMQEKTVFIEQIKKKTVCNDFLLFKICNEITRKIKVPVTTIEPVSVNYWQEIETTVDQINTQNQTIVADITDFSGNYLALAKAEYTKVIPISNLRCSKGQALFLRNGVYMCASCSLWNFFINSKWELKEMQDGSYKCLSSDWQLFKTSKNPSYREPIAPSLFMQAKYDPNTDILSIIFETRNKTNYFLISAIDNDFQFKMDLDSNMQTNNVAIRKKYQYDLDVSSWPSGSYNARLYRKYTDHKSFLGIGWNETEYDKHGSIDFEIVR